MARVNHPSGWCLCSEKLWVLNAAEELKHIVGLSWAVLGYILSSLVAIDSRTI